MKIIIAASSCYKSAKQIDLLIEDIKGRLSDKNKVDSFVLPFNYSGEDLSQALAMKLVDIRHECDALITIDYPACMLDHVKKICIFTDFSGDMQMDISSDKRIFAKKKYVYHNSSYYSNDGRVIDIVEEVARL